MMRRLTEREQNILIVAMAMVVLTVVYNSVVGPLLEKSEMLDQEIERFQAQWIQEKAVVARSKTIDAKFDIYLDQFSRPGTKEETESAVLSEIETVARKLGVQVTSLKPGRASKDGYDDRFSVSVTSNSEFLKVIRFLYELQQSPHFFDVEGLAFEKSARKDMALMTSRLILTKVFISLNEKQQYE